MLVPDHEQTPRPQSHVQPHKKGPPPPLRIDMPTQIPSVLALGDSSASTSSLSSANSESDFYPSLSKPSKPRSMRNTKKLSLILPTHAVSASPSQHLASAENAHLTDDSAQTGTGFESIRRASLASIPISTISSRLHRKDEDEPLTSPYANGPIQILPRIWLGSEDNAQNWKDLKARDIRSILNVAKEVNLPLDLMEPSRTPNESYGNCSECFSGTFYPANESRPAVHYLKLPWSHGQPDLVSNGFVAAMAFVDSALNRGDGVLIHCQCGISRSATVAIALVMRAAALALPSAPSEVLALKGTGFSGAYDYVKQKSNCIGPNMSLIYQLQDYQSTLNSLIKSPLGSEQSSISGDSEEEWSRQRRLIEEEQKEEADIERESVEVLQEAYALDKAMEERRVTRRASTSSVGSSAGPGTGCIWKSIHSNRQRTGSMTSNVTTGSIISENLIEEDEEEQLLGIGGGFDAPSISTRSASGETTEEEAYLSPGNEMVKVVPSLLKPSSTVRPYDSGKELYEEPEPKMNRSLPSAPPTKTSFDFTSRLQFKFKPKLKVKPQILSSLPPVPSSPNVPVASDDTLGLPQVDSARRRPPPPLIISSAKSDLHSTSQSCQMSQPIHLNVVTPSQTLFVFPPSPTLASATPHMVTVTSNLSATATQSSFPCLPTPRLSSFKTEGVRKRTFIGFAVAPSTPTTACSRVDARGWVGLGSCGS